MRSQESPSSRRNRDRRGTACVEFAIVAVPLFVLTFGAVDIGQYVNASQAVTDAAREGCRLASQQRPGSQVSEADVRTAVLNYLKQCYPRKQNELADALTVTASLTTTSGNPVWVQVDFEFGAVRWLAIPGLPRTASWSTEGKVLRSKTTMRRE